MNIYGYVYKATCKVTGKAYIGQAVNVHKRKKQHFQGAMNRSKAHPKFYAAIRKYGIRNFEWQIIDCSGTLETLKLCEMYWIEKYDTLHNGFNCTPGGDGLGSGKNCPNAGRKRTKETRMKMRLAKLGKKRKPFTKETKIRMSQAHKNPSKEIREKLRRSRLGKRNPMYGVKYIDGKPYRK